MKPFLMILISLLSLVSTKACFALQADEVLLIVNRNNASSLELAEYYRNRRQIPQANLLTVNMTDQEGCSREEYQRKLIEPVRKYLARRKGTPIRCLLLFYGIPLRVAAPELSQQQWHELEDLEYTKKQLDWQLEHRQLTEEQKQQHQQKSKQLGAQIDKLIGSLLSDQIRYNKDSRVFELPFDGDPEKQYKILQILVQNGMKIIDFTVSKANLLESLYLQYISQSDKTYKDFQKKAVKIEKII